MKKILLFLVFFTFGISAFFLFKKTAWAAEEFLTNFDLTYEVQKSGVTRITYSILLTNLTSTHYASEYTLTVNTEKIQNVSAFTPQGGLKFAVEKQSGKTQIRIFFNEKVVGKGQTLRFGLSYENDEIAQKNGRIWEIIIPKFNLDPTRETFEVNLRTPSDLGSPAYSLPPPWRQTTAQDWQILTWQGQQLFNGLRLAFGDFQLFDFKLTYHLKNPNLYPVFREIALPPDTAYQRVNISQIRPQPNKVFLDKDKNWLARFNLSPGQKLTVQVWGKAQIFSQAKFATPKISEENFSAYLLPQKYWEVKETKIQELAQKLMTPQAIYNYVVQTLTYDFQKVASGGERLGAQGALENPNSAICTEFTDLFVALARAAQIPAREINGFAFTTDPKLRPLSLEKDILHAWPEYFDKEKNTWVMVDPTWGKTTGGFNYFDNLDFNHFAFVIKGQNSEKPLPAGAYKLEEKSKDVEVIFSHRDFSAIPNLDLKLEIPGKIFTGILKPPQLEIKNLGPGAFYDGLLTIRSQKLALKNTTFKLKDLPPYASEIITLELLKLKPLSPFTDTLEISVSDQTFTYPVKVIPLNGWVPGLILGAFLGFLIFLFFKKRVFASFWKKNPQND